MGDPIPPEPAEAVRAALADADHRDRLIVFQRMLTILRDQEGHSVTLLCDNPDFQGANNAVEVCGDWTNWEQKRFEGESLFEAVYAATHAYNPARARQALVALDERGGGEAVLEAYDAGLLNDYGGGNVEWWQDYVRAELGRAHDFYAAQFSNTPASGGAVSREAGDE